MEDETRVFLDTSVLFAAVFLGEAALPFYVDTPGDFLAWLRERLICLLLL